MSRCANCNAEIPEGARFCPTCGLQAGARKETSTVTIPRESLERVNKTLADVQTEREEIAERLKKVEEQPDALDEEKVRKMLEDMFKEQGQAQQAGERRIEWPVEDWDPKERSFRDLIVNDTKDERIMDLQRWNDRVYLCSRLLGKDPRELRSFQRHLKPLIDSLQRAMDTATTAEGKEWIPTEYSARLIEKVKNRLNVARLFPRFTLPTSTYNWPIEGADAVAYLFSEMTGDTGQTKFTASTPGTDKIQFSAVGFASRTLWSRMLTEDSIIGITEYILRKHERAFAVAQEQSTINGDTAGTHMDSDVVNAKDARKAWNGLRKEVTADAKVDLSTFNADVILQMFNKLDTQYAEDLSELVFLASIAVAIKFLLLRDAQNNLLVTTRSEVENTATIVRGHIGQLFSVPVVNSGYIRRDLNASGVYDGVTMTKTLLLLVWRDAYMFGDYRNYTTQLLRELYAESDQDALVATQRLDYKRMQPSTDKLSAMGRNISSI